MAETKTGWDWDKKATLRLILFIFVIVAWLTCVFTLQCHKQNQLKGEIYEAEK